MVLKQFVSCTDVTPMSQVLLLYSSYISVLVTSSNTTYSHIFTGRQHSFLCKSSVLAIAKAFVRLSGSITHYGTVLCPSYSRPLFFTFWKSVLHFPVLQFWVFYSQRTPTSVNGLGDTHYRGW